MNSIEREIPKKFFIVHTGYLNERYEVRANSPEEAVTKLINYHGPDFKWTFVEECKDD